MKVTLKYFGQLVDVMGNHEETREISSNNSNELLEQMKQNNPIGHIPFQLAINDKLIDQKAAKKLNDGDVIALLPPYAGG
ncbi:MoaD/ThiS family protein [Leeuwenhoekiella marinoflava]|uniref:Molybdopterin synthase sulfur carrier subunit n=2 Tax=Leeuwenhoekiella marinoflava TaxID=988 RepID=A0A4Q0PNY1_9FLAO|nr:MoaD/ThiS family protein [Leeuwenhoekiella marinoflava]RXG32227.1 molybdopterin synthase sulfur carrier subunit [Leeuwenhoekiella marinoflava]SHE82681.1 molybdopterin synthase sulfur carrier subunit [Leeuwenhoekiella marinoflava DSM 3653]